MNKLILGLLCVVSFTLNVTAQVEPEKAFKKAKKAYSSYNLDPANNAASLPEAYEMISVAVTSEEVAAQFNTWQLKAQICNSIVTTESNEVLNGTKKEMAVGTVEKAMEAYDATEMAVKTALKKFQKTATKTLWRETGTTMSNMYVFYVQQDMYAEAFPYANNLISVHDKLAEMGEIYFEDELAFQDQMYAAAFCGNRAGSADAKGLYKRLIDLGWLHLQFGRMRYRGVPSSPVPIVWDFLCSASMTPRFRTYHPERLPPLLAVDLATKLPLPSIRQKERSSL